MVFFQLPFCAPYFRELFSFVPLLPCPFISTSYNSDGRSAQAHDILDSTGDGRIVVEAVLNKELVGHLQVPHCHVVERARLDQSDSAHGSRLRVEARAAGAAEREHVVLARETLACVLGGGAGDDAQRVGRDGEVGAVAGAAPLLAVGAVADGRRDGVA